MKIGIVSRSHIAKNNDILCPNYYLGGEAHVRKCNELAAIHKRQMEQAQENSARIQAHVDEQAKAGDVAIIADTGTDRGNAASARDLARWLLNKEKYAR